MCTVESEIHQRVKEKMVESSETDTVHILRTLRNTARVFKNAVSTQVVEMERQAAKLEEILPLVSGQLGRKVYEDGDIDAGIWSSGQTLGLINDIVRVPRCSH